MSYSRWLRYGVIWVLGVTGLWLTAASCNTVYAGWICGAMSMLWSDVLRSIRRARDV